MPEEAPDEDEVEAEMLRMMQEEVEGGGGEGGSAMTQVMRRTRWLPSQMAKVTIRRM